MRKKIIVISTVVLVFILAFGFIAKPVLSQSPAEVWVDDEYTNETPGWGETHFAAIQAGINAVASGGIVHVAEGTYHEQIIIDKTLWLKGEHQQNTIVEYPSTLGETEYLMLVNAENVRISGLKLLGHFVAANRAVYVVYSYKSGLIVEDSVILGFIGVFGNLTDAEIRNNYIATMSKGIYVSGGDNLLIDGNTFEPAEAAGWYAFNSGAIYMDHASYVMIRGNAIENFSSTIDPSITAGRGIEGSHNNYVTISGNTFENIRDAITMWIVTNVNISQNHITESQRYGINIKGQDIFITENAILDSGDSGINIAEYVIETENVVINYNNIVGNEKFGVVSNVGDITVDASNNWWGSATGPTRQLPNGRWVGEGDKVSANVAFVPWLPRPLEFWER
jgi:nitrous oxidase accessory protein NosD